VSAALWLGLVIAQQAPDGWLRVGAHTFRVTASNTLEIATNGRVAKRISGHNFSLGPFDDAPPEWRNGHDINSDGIPEVIVREDAGGAHCCTSWRIFSAGPSVQQIFTVDNGHTDFFPFEDLNDDGNLEIKIYDWTFAYWHASFADSPAIVLVYDWTDGAYRFAPDLTRRSSWPPAEIRKRATGIRWKGPGPEGVPPEFFTAMLDLIGTGNAAQVAAFVELAWPARRSGKSEFLREFYGQLRRSSHWRELEQLNGGALEPHPRKTGS
jgi:hypothetical protein